MTTTEAARRLAGARATGRPCAPVRDLLAAGDIAGAYAVQAEWVSAQIAAGARVAGRKVGLTSPAVQAQLGVDQPDFGTLLDTMGCPAGQVVDIGRTLQPRIEAEIAFVLARDLTAAAIGPEEVAAATAYVVPALEIVDSRIAGWDISIVDTVADNASSGLFTLGGPGRPIAEVDVAGCAMTMWRGEEVVWPAPAPPAWAARWRRWRGWPPPRPARRAAARGRGHPVRRSRADGDRDSGRPLSRRAHRTRLGERGVHRRSGTRRPPRGGARPGRGARGGGPVSVGGAGRASAPPALARARRSAGRRQAGPVGAGQPGRAPAAARPAAATGQRPAGQPPGRAGDADRRGSCGQRGQGQRPAPQTRGAVRRRARAAGDRQRSARAGADRRRRGRRATSRARARSARPPRQLRGQIAGPAARPGARRAPPARRRPPVRVPAPVTGR